MTVVILLVVLSVLVAAAAGGVGAYALRRHNRVVRGVNSPTSVGWLVSGRKEAKLHRRLRNAGRRLELAPATEGVADVAVRLRVELVELDAHLVTVARRPSRTRRGDRKVVHERILQVEELVRRIEERGRREPVSLAELAERLDTLEAADDELRELGPG